MTLQLEHIRIFPIKSLDPLEVDHVQVIDGAGLAGDREYALFNGRGNLLTAKRLDSKIVSIRAAYQDYGRRVCLQFGQESREFDLENDQSEIEAWFSTLWSYRITLNRNSKHGFQDDQEASGPTVLSCASLESVSYNMGLELEETRRRFRANLEFSGFEAFEEDMLYGPPGKPRRFRVGDVEFLGINPCARCVMPGLDSRTGKEGLSEFRKKLSLLRLSQIHPQTEIARYGNYYRLAVNTRLAPSQGGKQLSIGDVLTIL